MDLAGSSSLSWVLRRMVVLMRELPNQYGSVLCTAEA